MAGHLVAQVCSPTRLHDLGQQLRAAHQFLVAAARATVPRLVDLSSESWGGLVKREHVTLPSGKRPLLVNASTTKHSFAEVVNQCATLERLIDTLSWAEGYDALEDATVVRCNPTTSSAPRKKGALRDADDHDLVLDGRDGTRWRFEISDVASENDGNGKEQKDLTSLGILPRELGGAAHWPGGRSLLVVSSEFAERLRRPTRHGLRLGLFHYWEVKDSGLTRIFEVRQGPRPDGASPSTRS